MLRHTQRISLFCNGKILGEWMEVTLSSRKSRCYVLKTLRENFDEDFMNIEVTLMLSHSNNALYMRELMRKQGWRG